MTSATVDRAVPPMNPDLATASSPTRKQASTAALSLLPAFIDRLRWGNLNAAGDIVDQMASALEITHPTVSAKLRRHRTAKPVEMKLPAEVLSFEEPSTRFNDVILPEAIEIQLPAFVQEHRRADELARFGLPPRHKILLEGPPGNGKTMLAEAFSGELGIPLLRANYAGMVDSHLGETGKNLAKAFRYSECGPCVLFLDEFDAVGSDRSTGDLGEMKRITNQLLMLIDRMPTHCVLICATNLGSAIDPALVRRFDHQMTIPAPDQDRRYRCALKELAPSLTPGLDVTELAANVAKHEFPNLASLVRRCQEIRRDLVLNDGQLIRAIADRPLDDAA